MASRPNVWVIGGALAPIVYVVAVVLGGLLTPGYSHLAGPVGALTMARAPAAPMLIPLFALYNALLIGFALTLRDAWLEKGVRLTRTAPIALAVTALLGALMLFYPMDPVGLPTTETGRLHLWLGRVAYLATIIAVLATARSLRRYPAWRGLAVYSYASLAAMVATGTWGAAVGETSPLLGLAERATIGAFLQWLFVLALALLLARSPPTAA